MADSNRIDRLDAFPGRNLFGSTMGRAEVPARNGGQIHYGNGVAENRIGKIGRSKPDAGIVNDWKNRVEN